MTWKRSTLPADLGIGILHLGLGAFHRAHQAAFTEDAIAAAGGDWGIAAVSMRNPALANTLTAQRGRYGLIERHPDGPRLSEISVIREALSLPDDPVSVLARFADPGLHIVTITVTEKGYGVAPGSRDLDPAHPAIAHDLTAPGAPRGLIGVIAAGLARRRDAGLGGLTLMSCDNLPDNGELLRALVLAFTHRTDPTLAHWIEAECRFPNAMIDRITPAPTDDTRRLAQRITGHADAAAVETEPFRQWVIEDAFAGPRPRWDSAGAQIVADVAPFETMKLRMLNGAHSLIAYVGVIGGFAAVRDVMAQPRLARLVARHMADAATTITPTEGLDTHQYAEALSARFANPAIDHRCIQIAMDGSQKLPQRIFTPALLRLRRGLKVDSFAFATAAWLRHVELAPSGGPDDPMRRELRGAMARGDAGACVAAIGGLPGLSGQELFADPGWSDAVAGHLGRLRDRGLSGAVDALGAGPE